MSIEPGTVLTNWFMNAAVPRSALLELVPLVTNLMSFLLEKEAYAIAKDESIYYTGNAVLLVLTPDLLEPLIAEMHGLLELSITEICVPGHPDIKMMKSQRSARCKMPFFFLIHPEPVKYAQENGLRIFQFTCDNTIAEVTPNV